MKNNIHMGQFVISSKKKIGIIGAMDAIQWAKKKNYNSGHRFQFRGSPVRVWLRGHYLYKAQQVKQ